MQHVSDAQLYRPDPAAPKRRWLQPSIAEADPVVIYDRSPNVAQPFRLVNGSIPADYVPGDSYWLKGVAEDGNRVWRLQLIAVRSGGQDIVLDMNIIA